MNHETIRKLTDFADDARMLLVPEDLVELGADPEFIASVTNVYESNLDDPKDTFYDNEGKPMNQVRCVIAYDLVEKLAEHVGADTSKVEGMGLSRRARQYRDLILAKLKEQTK